MGASDHSPITQGARGTGHSRVGNSRGNASRTSLFAQQAFEAGDDPGLGETPGTIGRQAGLEAATLLVARLLKQAGSRELTRSFGKLGVGGGPDLLVSADRRG